MEETLNARGRFEALDEQLRRRGFRPGVCRSGSDTLRMWWWGQAAGRDATLRVESHGIGPEPESYEPGPDQWRSYVVRLGLKTTIAVRFRVRSRAWAKSIWTTFDRLRGAAFLRSLTGIEGQVTVTKHERWVENMASDAKAVDALRAVLEGEPQSPGPARWTGEPSVSGTMTPAGGAFVYRSAHLEGRALSADVLLDLAERMNEFLDVVEELPPPENPARPSWIDWLEAKSHVLWRSQQVLIVLISLLLLVSVIYFIIGA